MIAYMSVIQIKSLSRIVSEKNENLLFGGHSVHTRSKITSPTESPYMISYMSVIQMKSLSHIFSEKNEYLLLRGHSVHPRSKVT